MEKDGDGLLVQKVILSISSASVPHPALLAGGLESRSLSYYLGAGIDHFNHDYARHETLLTKAAEQAIAMIRQHDASTSSGQPGARAAHLEWEATRATAISPPEGMGEEME